MSATITSIFAKRAQEPVIEEELYKEEISAAEYWQSILNKNRDAKRKLAQIRSEKNEAVKRSHRLSKK